MDGSSKMEDLMKPAPPFPLAAVLIVLAVGLSIGVAIALWRRSTAHKRSDHLWTQIGDTTYRYRLAPATEEYRKLAEQYVPGTDTQPLKQALFRRALANCQLVLHIQEQSHSAHTLYKRSMIQEQAWQNFKRSEEMVQREIQEVRHEAEHLQPGLGEVIWGEAMQTFRQLQERQRQVAMAQQQAAAAAAGGGGGNGSAHALPMNGNGLPNAQPAVMPASRDQQQQEGAGKPREGLTPEQQQRLAALQRSRQQQKQAQLMAVQQRQQQQAMAATSAGAIRRNSSESSGQKQVGKGAKKEDKVEQMSEEAAREAQNAADRAASELLAEEARQRKGKKKKKKDKAN